MLILLCCKYTAMEYYHTREEFQCYGICLLPLTSFLKQLQKLEILKYKIKHQIPQCDLQNNPEKGKMQKYIKELLLFNSRWRQNTTSHLKIPALPFQNIQGYIKYIYIYVCSMYVCICRFYNISCRTKFFKKLNTKVSYIQIWVIRKYLIL